MEPSNLFAIVDIETTGTNQEKDKIIQFACVIVENQKIVNQLSIDINPLRSIPRNISELTGITNKDVANSPYFEDVAFTIKQLLDGCVFVAHNVFFDYHFLNSELIRAGLEPLNVQCIDTVELFQVLYPTSSGFRVSDMANELNISHDNPHQALSDAFVTAEAFIRMVDKLRSLPLVTVETLANLSNCLGVDNSALFEMIHRELLDEIHTNTFEEIIIIDHLALKKKERDYRYQHSDEIDAVNSIFRPSRKVMIDSVKSFIEKSDDKKNLLIEAETGTGKTLGYLYPLQNMKKKQSVLISTSTILLQHQILNQDIPFLNEVTQSHVNGVIVKAAFHYISLTSFVQTLKHPLKQKNYALCQMAVLVWLLETKTGDLDELNVNKTNPFYQQVSHLGMKELSMTSIFSQEDFFNYLIDKCQFADFIIVNHSFLFSDSQKTLKFLPDFDIVVVDEAHRLPSLIEDMSIRHVSVHQLSHNLNQLIELVALIPDNHSLKNDSLMIETISYELKETIDWLEQSLFHYFYSQHTAEECLIDINELYRQLPMIKRSIRRSNTLCRDFSELYDRVKGYHSSHVSLIEKEFVQLFQCIVEQMDVYQHYFNDFEEKYVKWINGNKSKLNLFMIDFNQLSIEKYEWYQRAKKIIYTSGSLQLDNESEYFEEKLGLTQVEKKQLPRIFDYSKQAELFVLKDVYQKQIASTKDFAKSIFKVVKDMYEEYEKTMLVLFTSHQLLEAVNELLIDYFNQRDVLILSQGISGTKEKIIKKINQGNRCIILGANSFWEGMDLSGQSIDIVIMTKLPFDPPNRPIIQARYNYIEQQGLNPFYHDAIPKTGIRLRQGIGRLLRNPEDKGILVVLDDRLVNSSYASMLQSYLPKELNITQVNLSQLIEQSRDFLENK